MNLFNNKKRKAEKLYQKFTEIDDEDKHLEILLQVLDLDPDHQLANYNVGFIHKYQGSWEPSLFYNKRAYELDDEDEAARWNMAIAATALGEWDIARQAWIDCGIQTINESGPVEANCGMTPIRLNPDGEQAEVVWGTRIDPARTRIENIPFRESGFRYGDVVLNDGAPVGYRTHRDTEYPVFNVLELLEASDYLTYILKVEINTDEDFEVLDKALYEAGHEIEDWTSNTRMLCKQCSEGTPHEAHDQELEKEWTGERTLAIATTDFDSVESMVTQWVNERSCRVDLFE